MRIPLKQGEDRFLNHVILRNGQFLWNDVVTFQYIVALDRYLKFHLIIPIQIFDLISSVGFVELID